MTKTLTVTSSVFLDLLNDLCAVFIGGALRDLLDVILSLFLLQTIH